MTHDELEAIAQQECREVKTISDLEPALVGYIWDKLRDGFKVIRAVYDYDKSLDCLVGLSKKDEEAEEELVGLINWSRATEFGPIFIHTNL